MYRPTVRYSDVYRTYVDKMFHATTLDRNQIIRCALFTAAHNPSFLKLMEQYKRSDVPLPSSLWPSDNHDLWMGQDAQFQEGGVSVDYNERERKASNVTKIPGAPTNGRTISKPTISTTNNMATPAEGETSLKSNRRQPQAQRHTGAVSPKRLSNGGITIDLR